MECSSKKIERIWQFNCKRIFEASFQCISLCRSCSPKYLFRTEIESMPKGCTLSGVYFVAAMLTNTECQKVTFLSIDWNYADGTKWVAGISDIFAQMWTNRCTMSFNSIQIRPVHTKQFIGITSDDFRFEWNFVSATKSAGFDICIPFIYWIARSQSLVARYDSGFFMQSANYLRSL